MKRASPKPSSLVLGLHPVACGVGWIIFESPLSPIDWAIARSTKNATCLNRIEELIERFTPAVVVLEEFEKAPTIRVDRIRRLCRAVVHLADNRGCDVHVYSKAAVRTCFASLGARTRYEIAQATAAHIPSLKHRLPPARKFSNNQDARLALFNAAALTLTHFALAGDQSDFR